MSEQEWYFPDASVKPKSKVATGAELHITFCPFAELLENNVLIALQKCRPYISSGSSTAKVVVVMSDCV